MFYEVIKVNEPWGDFLGVSEFFVTKLHEGEVCPISMALWRVVDRMKPADRYEVGTFGFVRQKKADCFFVSPIQAMFGRDSIIFAFETGKEKGASAGIFES